MRELMAMTGDLLRNRLIFVFQLKETYRFHPVSATGYPRVVPKQGILFAGRNFPEGVCRPPFVHSALIVF